MVADGLPLPLCLRGVFGIGTALGFAMIYAKPGRTAREGGRTPKGRLTRIWLSLRGTLAGGAPNSVGDYLAAIVV